MAIPSIRVDLDDEHIQAMEPILAKARAEADEGTPGMILAQVFGGYMRVFYLDNAKAEDFQRMMGAEVGRTSRDAIVR